MSRKPIAQTPALKTGQQMVECERDRRETELESPWFILQAPTTQSVGCLHQPVAGRRWPGQSVTVWFPRSRPCLSGLGLCAPCAGCMTGTSEVDSTGRERAQACLDTGRISRGSIVEPCVPRNRGWPLPYFTACGLSDHSRFSVAFAVVRRAAVSGPGRKPARSGLQSTTRRALLASFVL